MGLTSTSLSASSIFSQIQLPKPKFGAHNVSSSLNNRFTILRYNYNPNSKTLFHSIANKFHTPSHNPIIPSSKLSESDKTRKIFRIFVEKFVGFLVGSFIFMGCFNLRHSIASPAQTMGENANGLEEMRERILEHDSRDIDTLKVVLYGKMRSGKTGEAVKYVMRLIDLEPDEVEWRLLLALCYETMGQLDMAKGLFLEILEKNPLFIRALHGLSLVMHKNNEGRSVFEMLSKALDIAQHEKKVNEERSIRILIAQMHVVKGELEEGLKKFQDLVDDNPRDFRPYISQGIIYSLLDKKKEALEQFEIYRALVPDEFPQREFIDDVILSATTATREQFQKEFDAEFSHKK